MSTRKCISDDEDDKIDTDVFDEDEVADAPISFQATYSKLLASRNKLKLQASNFKTKLKKAQNWCEELRLQIEDLNGKLAEKKKSKNCVRCAKLKRQLTARKLTLKSVKSKLAAKEVETEVIETQTTEEDLRQAAWVYQYSLNIPAPATKPDTQTNGCDKSLAEDIRSAAEDALILQGMVLETTSGLYYDYKTGYYYDANKSLYYDGNTGNYLKYDQETKEYQIECSLPEEEIAAQKELARRRDEMSKHKVKRRKVSCDSNDKTDQNNKGNDETNKLSADDLDAELENDILESSIPCIRLNVIQSEDEKVKVGSLYIVTCTGATIGSKGTHEVLLPDLGCSKLHARFTFHTSTCTYSLKDLGSRNGTWVNGKRLSKPKEESKEVVVGHKTIIQIGKTKLSCHLHPGVETCRECEPGLNLKEEKICDSPSNGSLTKELLRKKELKDMKAQYGLGVGLPEESSENAGLYKDRAEERRFVHGVDPINAKTETASVDQAIGSKNKGYKMLTKMGWDGGGLGKGADGIEEPVRVEQRAAQAGLGSQAASIVQSSSGKEAKKNEIWKKTARRFSKVPVLDAFKQQDSEDESS